MSKDIGIVICNFNKREYLQGCLKTLFASNLQDNTFDVIVVDNASSDDSVEFVRNNYQSVILLENEINTGGSGGFDRGIRYCIEKKYEYVCLLDNDILLEKDTILKLLQYIKSNANVGIVGSKICTMDNPDILQELGSFIDWEDRFNVSTPYKGHKDDTHLPEVVKCDYVPACCLITTKEVLNKVGSFNTDHFIYWDDMDWCTRVKKAGYEVHSINESRVFHKMGASNHINTFGVYYFERNRILFYLKYLDDEKLEMFMKKISAWLLSVIFFSNEKKAFATPKSLLMALDDLLTNQLGRQDKSIIEKEKSIDIFQKYTFSKQNSIAFVLNGDMNANRNIFMAFKNFYSNSEKFAVFSKKDDVYLNSFDSKIIQNNDLKNYDTLIYTYRHILDFKEEDLIEHKNAYIMDAFFNSSKQEEFYKLKNSYDNFKSIYENIFEPVIFEKLKKIRSYHRK